MGEAFGASQAYSAEAGSCPRPRSPGHPCGSRVLRLAVLAVAAAGLAGCAVTLPSLWERTQTTPPAGQSAPATATAQAEPAGPAAARDQAPSGGTGEPLRLQAYQADDPVTTGSIRRPPPQDAGNQPAAAAGTAPIPDADWQAARRVLLEALADPADTPSLPWENGESGMRGTVTALQRANGTAGQTCRNFLGSAIKDGKEVWFDGRACRSAGAWAVLEVRPWRRG